jgi:NADH-quinone oxidoreductase subunit N
MLIGVAAAAAPHARSGEGAVAGIDSVLFYLVAYAAMTLGAFAVFGYLRKASGPVETVDDLAGLSRSQPGMALLMALFLFSLIGIPLTAGFVGKLLVFQGALAVPAGADGATPDQARLFRILALIGALNAAIGAWYYLRLTVVMFLRPPSQPVETDRSWPALASIWACAIITIAFGVYPDPLARAVQNVAGRTVATTPNVAATR